MKHKNIHETVFSKIKKRGWKFVALYLAVKWSVWGMIIYFSGKFFSDS